MDGDEYSSEWETREGMLLRKDVMPVHPSFSRDVFDLAWILSESIPGFVRFFSFWHICIFELMSVRSSSDWNDPKLCEGLKKSITRFYHGLETKSEGNASRLRVQGNLKASPGPVAQARFHADIKSMLDGMIWKDVSEEDPWNENLYRCLGEVCLYMEEHRKTHHGRIPTLWRDTRADIKEWGRRNAVTKRPISFTR